MKRIKLTLSLRREGFGWLPAWRIAGLRLAREAMEWGLL